MKHGLLHFWWFCFFHQRLHGLWCFGNNPVLNSLSVAKYPGGYFEVIFFSRFVDKLKYNIWVIKYKRLCYYRWWNIKNICLCKYFHLSCQNSQVIGRWCQNTDSNSQGCRNQAKPYFKGFARVERCECRRMSWWISQKRTAVQINSIGRWNSQRIMKISEIW